ncbi:hypothetical protein CC86DRAFT_440031 [Ophiobolus disseminans]|uniref:MYND-type domain-containing protein n=1 Tax=Ophiobolus disseminans TaxID=1469910 RepID=A0A6A7A4L8_9PLEO|nr:hypothetical protein CC86DRAFT_440031 [Ophiobolus disseminans]
MDVSVFLNPPLCANNNQQLNGTHIVCTKDAGQVCGACNLVQYCSKKCQVTDWPHHKKMCKSALMKSSWVPNWSLTGRKPTFIGDGSLVTFGSKKFLWGNTPALDVLKLEDNIGVKDLDRDFHLLFAASGDLRNVVKTIVGISDSHKGSCVAVLNDRDLAVVARNTIMLLVTLFFDVDTSVPIIIHLWYSALLPEIMIQALQTSILPFISDVCEKIKDKAEHSVQAKTFSINGRTLRLVLMKEEWMQLAQYFQRLDYRERSMLQWAPARRQVNYQFREKGILIPYGCSSEDFVVPNSTLFQNKVWPMKDSLAPRDGWSQNDYLGFASGAKADEYGALFIYLHDLLTKFCTRLRNVNVSFQLHCVNAQELDQCVGSIQFDRIEMANICDRGYLGPQKYLKIFSQRLKSRSDNPHATILMLFFNAAVETEKMAETSDVKTFRANLSVAMQRLTKYMPLDQAKLARIGSADELGRHPYYMRRRGCYNLLKDWDIYFNKFVSEAKLLEIAKLHELQMKKKHTLVEPWPFRVHDRATQAEFDALRSSSLSGCERYVEFAKTK